MEQSVAAITALAAASGEDEDAEYESRLRLALAESGKAADRTEEERELYETHFGQYQENTVG